MTSMHHIFLAARCGGGGGGMRGRHTLRANKNNGGQWVECWVDSWVSGVQSGSWALASATVGFVSKNVALGHAFHKSSESMALLLHWDKNFFINFQNLDVPGLHTWPAKNPFTITVAPPLA